jgi:hypothetical protein
VGRELALFTNERIRKLCSGICWRSGVLCVLLSASMLSFSGGRSLANEALFAVAASTSSSNLDLTKLECLSLDPNWAHVDRIDHSDDQDMRDAVARHFTNVSLNSPNCSFFIIWTVVHRKTFAVRYRGNPSVALMSFSVCKKPLESPAGRQCLSKNIWIFEKISPPATEYAVGIKAFVSSPNVEWSVVNISSVN